MAYLFKHGILTEDHQHWIKQNAIEFPYAIYLTDLPNDLIEKYGKKSSYSTKSTNGHVTTRELISYTSNIVLNGKIVLFKEKHNYDLFTNESGEHWYLFSSYVIDPIPLQTIII